MNQDHADIAEAIVARDPARRAPAWSAISSMCTTICSAAISRRRFARHKNPGDTGTGVEGNDERGRLFIDHRVARSVLSPLA